MKLPKIIILFFFILTTLSYSLEFSQIKKSGNYKGYHYIVSLPKMITGKYKDDYNDLIKILGKNTILDRIDNLDSDSDQKNKQYRINYHIYDSDLGIYTIHIIENISGKEKLVRNIYVNSKGKMLEINDIFTLKNLIKIYNIYNKTNNSNISENDIILSGILENIVIKDSNILIGKENSNKYNMKECVIPIKVLFKNI